MNAQDSSVSRRFKSARPDHSPRGIARDSDENPIPPPSHPLWVQRAVARGQMRARYGIAAGVLGLLVFGCGEGWRHASVEVCPDPDLVQATAVECLAAANTSSVTDEEPEDWISRCYLEARGVRCRQEAGVRLRRADYWAGPPIPCSSEDVPPAARPLCDPAAEVSR